MLAVVWIICIGVFVLFIYLFNVLPVKKHEERKQNHINNLLKLHSNMTVEDVKKVMGNGEYIDWYRAEELEEKYNKNLSRGYFTENRDISNNPIYKIRLGYNEEVLYYGETRYDYSTDGYRETNTYYYFAIIVYFKNGIIDRVEDHNSNIIIKF